MDYVEIRDLVSKNNISEIDIEIVSCVNSSSYNLNDEEYYLVCRYVYNVWTYLDKTYIQLLSDIVCDLYQDNLDYGYRDEEDDKYLTLDDLKECEKINMVINMFYDKYYD